MKKILMSLVLLFNLISTCYGAEPKKLVVLLDWFVNPNHAPLFVAQEKGFFKEQGLDVELIGPADPSDPPKLVAAGKADIAITYEPDLFQQIEQGLPLIRIGTLIDKPLNCLVVLKNSSIHSIHDLKNKKIGYSTGGMNSTTLNVMLEHNGLDINEVEKINVHYDLTQALLSKKVDAVTGMMRNFELIQMELAGHPGLAFFPEQNGIPSYSELIFVTAKNHLKDPRLPLFLAALKKSTDYLKKHPEEMWLAFSKSHPELNNALNKRAWFMTIPDFADHPEKFDTHKWLTFGRFMQSNGLIKTLQPINNYSIDLMKEST
jgi:putative hydroxymethylpyrimidine transport system substrate-binding protein